MDKKLAGLILTAGLVIWCTSSAGDARSALWEEPSLDAFTGPQAPLAYEWIVNGDQNGALFGQAVSSAGNVNGDGCDDVLVGAPIYSLDGDKDGAVFGYYGCGATGLGAAADWQVGSGQKGSRFGSAVGAAGDVNGDGFDDVIVGAYRYNTGLPEAGRAYLFFGSDEGLDTTPGWTLEGDQANSYLGISVGTAGDVNNDGYSDIIIGISGYTYSETNEGRAAVYYGWSEGISDTLPWVADGGQEAAQFGRSVGTAGDVNNDGFDDIIVGAPQYDLGEEDEGAAFVFFGSENGPSATPDWIADLDQAEAEFGSSVGSAGDVNHDLYDDIIVGAPLALDAGSEVGGAFVYHGSADGPSLTYDWHIFGNQIGCKYGSSVSAAGDVNGDDYADVVVGAYRWEYDQSYEGAAFVYLGSEEGLLTTSECMVEGNKVETELGITVSTAGHVASGEDAFVLTGAPLYRRDEKTLVGRALAFSCPMGFGYYDHASYLPLVLSGP